MQIDHISTVWVFVIIMHCFAETKLRPGLKNRRVSLWSATSTLKMWMAATLH